SFIFLNGHPGATVSDIRVNVSLNHTRNGDLTISLRAPSGTSVVLYSSSGDTGQNFNNTTFSDLALQSILTGTAPYNGTFRPVGALSALAGTPVDGAWTLVIQDNTSGNVGTLLNWSLSIDSVAAGALGTVTGNLMDQNANAVTDTNGDQ